MGAAAGVSPEWAPRASLETLRARARLLGEIRAFFARHDVLEVGVPALGHATVTEPAIESLRVSGAIGDDLYLQTSPEYAMKRLLAAYGVPIYALGPVFRDGESGRLHNPEFTMLEWYRPGYDLSAMIDEVAALVVAVLGPRPVERVEYGAAFAAALALDPFDASTARLAEVAHAHGLVEAGDNERDTLLEFLFSHAVAPSLAARTVFIERYPASQAALAAIDGAYALRFELFVDALEIANGYQELTDAREQRRRFEVDRARRRARGQHCPAADERLVAALAAGLPSCAGVALGVDRLLLRRLGLADLGDTLSFPFERA